MAERFTADLLFIIIVLIIAALLGYLLGYFLAKTRYMKKIRVLEEEKAALESQVKKLEEEKTNLQSDVSRLEEEKHVLQADIRKMDDEIASLKLTIDKLEKEIRIEEEQATKKGLDVPHDKVVKDDLKIIVGIGPKIENILKGHGIDSWKVLSETSPETIRGYLIQDGGERFRIHNPESWPRQAQLMHEGKWDELKELQGRIEA